MVCFSSRRIFYQYVYLLVWYGPYSPIQTLGGIKVGGIGIDSKIPGIKVQGGVLGNGTKVRVKLVCYGSGRMSGMRLEKVGVLEHVPYDPEMQEASGF